MLNAPTLEQLQALKLSAMATAWTDQQQQADMTALAFDERFALLVDAEWRARENTRLARALQDAKLKLSQAGLEAIDYPARRELDKAVIRQLATCRWVAEHQGILITGMTGTGKSFLACALAHQACRKGYRALYRRASRLFHELTLARAKEGKPPCQDHHHRRRELPPPRRRGHPHGPPTQADLVIRRRRSKFPLFSESGNTRGPSAAKRTFAR